MRPVPFNPSTDLAPLPFDEDLCELAAALKHGGLPWRPHVGCFVWDPQACIAPASPFPHQIYFILSLPRFVDILGSIEAIQQKMVWLPTWHQARLLGRQYKIDISSVPPVNDPAEELKTLYRLLIKAVTMMGA